MTRKLSPLLTLCLALAAPLASGACRETAEMPPPTPSVASSAGPAQAPLIEPTAAPRPAPDAEAREALVGWWLRHDQSYMMVIDAIGEDGRVDARYLNPQPVHVSRAEAWTEEGVVRLLLELTDENYPGSFYELAYQPDQDLWIGVYHHLGVDQDFEVYFSRFEEEEE